MLAAVIDNLQWKEHNRKTLCNNKIIIIFMPEVANSRGHQSNYFIFDLFFIFYLFVCLIEIKKERNRNNINDNVF